MSKIELSLTTDYCPSWGLWEGVREHIQNAKDAEEFLEKPMTIDYTPKTGLLRITSFGVTLNKSVLLLGKSDKRDGRNFRGFHGEGLKTGTLALVRAGYTVTIYNDDEKWTPELAASDQYNGEVVLVFNTRKLKNISPNFVVEISHIDQAVWLALKERFLFLSPPHVDEIHRFSQGAILLNEKYKALIYVKGIYVGRVNGLEMGYDLDNAELDRDRRVIDAWDLQWRLGQFWQEALKDNPELHGATAYRLLRNDALELRGLKHHADERVAKALRKELEKAHGQVVPVADEYMAREIEALGGKPVIVGPTLTEIMEKSGESAAKMAVRLRAVPKTFHPTNSLTTVELAMLGCWVYPIIPSVDVEVVDFHDSTMDALLLDGGKIGVARSALNNYPETLVKALAIQEANRRGYRAEDVLAEVLVRANPDGISVPTEQSV